MNSKRLIIIFFVILNIAFWGQRYFIYSIDDSDLDLVEEEEDIDIDISKSKFREKFILDFSPVEEHLIGRTLAALILSKYEVYGDDKSNELGNYINSIGYTVAMASTRPETYKGYRFIIIKDEKANAFTIPGGTIFISTALVRKADNEDELAAVLAHEIAHIELNHCTKAISKRKRLKAFDEVLRDDDEAFDSFIQEFKQNVFFGYDKKDEKDADLRAVQILARAGYSPRALSSILIKLKKGGGVHGNPLIRAKRVDENINQLKSIPKIDQNRNDRFNEIVRF